MATLMPEGKQSFTNSAGAPLVGGKVYTYDAGTSTPRATYQDAAGTVPNTNPIVLDARGEATIFWSGNYKVILKDAADATVWTVDGASTDTGVAALTAALASPASGQGANLVSMPISGTPAVGSVAERLAGTSNDGAGGFGAVSVTTPTSTAKTVAVKYPAVDGGNGTLVSLDGHATWLRFQPSQDESPIEAVFYPSGAQGRATATIGGNTVTRVSGTAFKAAWVGRKFYLGSNVYKVSTVPDGNTMTVTTVAGGAVSFASTFTETFHVFVIQGSGVCNVTGTTVARVSGDPFVPFLSTLVFKLAGVTRVVSSFTDINTLVLSSAPGDSTNTAYTYECDINDQITTLRVQKMIGSDEENLSVYARYDGYWIHSLFSGQGQYRKVILGSGELSAGTLARQVVAQANGDLTIGGDYDYEAIRVLNQAGAVNRLETAGASTGFSPSWRARGSDTNVGLGFDTKGSGTTTFTSNSFGKTEFQIFGSGGASWLAVGSAATAPVVSANGAAADIDIRLAPKGTGLVWLTGYTAGAPAATGYINFKDASGVTRKLLVG